MGALTMLGIAASAALIGCASLPSSPWRVQPAFRLENGGTDPAHGYLALAKQYEGEGRNALALDAYHKAAKAAPAQADVLNALGLALARHAQFAPAVTALRQAVALAPERAQLLNNLGYALLLDGRAEDARAMFRLTLAVEPSHELAARNLEYVNLQLAAAAAPKSPVQTATAEKSPAATPPTQMVAPTAPIQPSSSPLSPAAAGVAAESGVTASASKLAEIAAPDSVSAGLDSASIEIVNGNGINGAAARLRQLLRDQGIKVSRLANRPPYQTPHTQVLFRSGKADLARAIAQRMPIDAAVGLAPAGSTRADLTVLLGHDARHGAGCELLAACSSLPERMASAGHLNTRDPAVNTGTSRH